MVVRAPSHVPAWYAGMLGSPRSALLMRKAVVAKAAAQAWQACYEESPLAAGSACS